MKFHKSYKNELVSDDDIFTVFEMRGEISDLTQEEIANNRAIMKALLLAEEMKGSITIDKNESSVQITIFKEH